MTRYEKMQELKPIKEGKVREIYDNGDSLIMVATDRISCFSETISYVTKALLGPRPYQLFRCDPEQ